jgi:hypothetical protein
MTLLGTSILYGLLGAVVAVAMLLREEHPGPGRVALLLFLGVLFWPLFAPLLLGRSRDGGGTPAADAGETRFEPRIRAAEASLIAALARAKGGAGTAMAPEAARVRELVGALQAMAARLAKLEKAPGLPELEEQAARRALDDLAGRGRGPEDARVASLRTRLRNIERLRAMRARTADDLERALLKMEEITSQVLLLKFAGRPDAEVAELVSEIAEGVADMTDALLATG